MDKAVKRSGFCSRIFYMEKDYLILPVAPEQKTAKFSIVSEGEKLLELDMPVGTVDQVQYESAIPMKAWKGRTVELILCSEALGALELLDAVHESDDFHAVKGAVFAREESAQSRPALHFTAPAGWINDPNGLVYQDGTYHLYYQYNPVDTCWGNMTWGHAVSRDLLTWEKRPIVMLPSKEGTMYSGCAIVNGRGLLNLPESALLFFYTCAGIASDWGKENGSVFCQKLAYSLDGGETLVSYPEPIIPYECLETRDPKVYWHEKSQAYFMALYLDANDFALYRSEDLLSWKKTQTLTVEGMWECPDLRSFDTPEGEKWVFLSADGYYLVGDFDGWQFTPCQERRMAYQTTLPYAAQTYTGTEETILVKWIRTKNQGKNYTGCMSLPVELFLKEKDGQYLLGQRFITAYEEAKRPFEPDMLEKENQVQFELPACDEAVEICWEKENGRKEFLLNLGSTKIGLKEDRFQVTYCHSSLEDGALDLPSDVEQIRMLIDGPVLEVLSGDGLVYGVWELEQPETTTGERWQFTTARETRTTFWKTAGSKELR